MSTVDIRRSTLVSPDATRLIAALNAELRATFPEPGATHFSLTNGDGAFVVAYLDGKAVGCGAVRRLDGTTAELKRMYPTHEYQQDQPSVLLVPLLPGRAW